jgi:hypothetical protein
VAAAFGGLGRTLYTWRSDVDLVVHEVLRRWPQVSANTYVGHPFPGWSRVSIDFWGKGGRGEQLPRLVGAQILDYLWERRNPPHIRHTIFEHTLTTSWGGEEYWTPDDHSGNLRHVHVTYWK